MKNSMVRDSLRIATKRYLNEYSGMPMIHGKYPTSDDNDTTEHSRMSDRGEYGLQIKLANGDVASCVIVPLTPSIIYAGFTCNGEAWEVFDLPKSKSSYFNKFKKKIEDKYETQYVDEEEAKQSFDKYISVIFT